MRNDFKGPLTTDIILNFEKKTFNVKQRENEFADPLIILLSIFFALLMLCVT